MWQSLVLQKWKEVFAWIPVETLVYENQKEYYKVLQRADNVGANVVTNEEKIIAILRQDGNMSANMFVGYSIRSVITP